jgi:ORF6N domain
MAKQCAMIRRPVESRILFLGSRKVLPDSDLAELYRVTVKRLNEQFKRNAERFPEDFMFRLTPKENKLLRSQIATSNGGRGGRRYMPFVFTEHGAIMAATGVRGGGSVIEARAPSALLFEQSDVC